MAANHKTRAGHPNPHQGKSKGTGLDEDQATKDVFKNLVKKRSLIFAMTGLKGAGKSTILSKLGIGQVQALRSPIAGRSSPSQHKSVPMNARKADPCKGASIEEIRYKGNGNLIRFVSWDGSPCDDPEDTDDVISSLSSKDNTLSFVFVIEQRDYNRGPKRDEAAKYLRQTLCGRRMPVLVLVNKSDQGVRCLHPHA